jgi:mannose/fructose/N-acetylgalactosamine-specific phosphotransferase system component IIB
LRYVFLAPDEEDQLRALAHRGIIVTAQDVPNASPVELAELLAGKGTG